MIVKRNLLFLFFVFGVGSVAAQTSDVRRSEALSMPRSRIGATVRFAGIGVPKETGVRQTPFLPTRLMPYVGVEYSYRVWNFLEVGASFSYAFYGLGSRSEAYGVRNELHHFLPAIEARYAWFNSRWVSLYSSVGLSLLFAHGVYYQKGEPTSSQTSMVSVYGEIAPVGVRVGRRLFGYVEPFRLSFDSWGADIQIRIGLGYTF